MGTAAEDKFCLRWNDFESNVSSSFKSLRQRNRFFDVSLVVLDDPSSEVKVVNAHRVILAACSPFFDAVLSRSHQNVFGVPNPMIYLRGINARDLAHILDFMYHGEVNVKQDDLNSFLAAAEDLKIKGLTESDSHEPSRKPGKVGHKREATENGKGLQTPTKKRTIIKQTTPGGGLGALLNSSKLIPQLLPSMPSPSSLMADTDDDHMPPPVRAELGTGEEEEQEGLDDSKDHFGNNSMSGQRLPNRGEFEDSFGQFDNSENSGDVSFGDGGSHGIPGSSAGDEVAKGPVPLFDENDAEISLLRGKIADMFGSNNVRLSDGTFQCLICGRKAPTHFHNKRHVISCHFDPDLLKQIDEIIEQFVVVFNKNSYTCLPCGQSYTRGSPRDVRLHFLVRHFLPNEEKAAGK